MSLAARLGLVARAFTFTYLECICGHQGHYALPVDAVDMTVVCPRCGTQHRLVTRLPASLRA